MHIDSVQGLHTSPYWRALCLDVCAYSLRILNTRICLHLLRDLVSSRDRQGGSEQLGPRIAPCMLPEVPGASAWMLCVGLERPPASQGAPPPAPGQRFCHLKTSLFTAQSPTRKPVQFIKNIYYLLWTFSRVSCSLILPFSYAFRGLKVPFYKHRHTRTIGQSMNIMKYVKEYCLHVLNIWLQFPLRIRLRRMVPHR